VQGVEMNEREFVAVHESSHAAAAKVFGLAAGYVSIEGGRNFAGTAAHRMLRVSDVTEADLIRPYPLMRARLKQSLESSICFYLAGDLGVQYLLRETEFTETPEDTEAAQRVAEIATFTERESGRLAALERDGMKRTDIENARVLSWDLVGTNVADELLRLMRAVTREQVLTERFATLVFALVPPLLKHGRLSAKAVRLILKEADPNEATT